MGQMDTQYRAAIATILEKGYVDKPGNVRPVYEDGEKATTVAAFNVQMQFDNSGDEALLLTTKKIREKLPITELRWIWQLMSNNVQELRDMGCNVWNEWELEDGTVGDSYGWQLKNKLQEIVVDELFIDMYFSNQFSFRPEDDDFYGEASTLLGGEAREVFRRRELGEVYKLNQVDFLLYSLKNNPHSRSIITTLFAIGDLDSMALKPCVYETQWKVFGDKLHLKVGVRSNDMALMASAFYQKW